MNTAVVQDSGGAVAVPNDNTAVVKMPDIAALQRESEYGGQVEFVGVAGPGFTSFLPYLMLFGSNSDQVKEGLVPVATLGYIEGKEKKLTLIGKTVLVCPLAWRAKAMFFKTADGKPVAFHKPKSEEFKKIRDAANADSNSGNMYGPEFLLWCPNEKKFMTFFMGSTTARNASQPVHALLPRSGGPLRAGILSAVLIDNGTHKWHGPTISLSDQSFDSPNPEDVTKHVVDFLNPRDSVIEEAAPPAAQNPDR